MSKMIPIVSIIFSNYVVRLRRISLGQRVLCACLLAAILSMFAIAAHAQSAQTQSPRLSLDAMKALYARPDIIPYPNHNKFSTAKAALGQQLFFDPRLSGTQAMSCASCHKPEAAWGDGRRTGVGSRGNDLDRRTPTILNLAWGELMFWDGRADNLEEQAVGPIQNPNEMNMPLPQLVASLGRIPGYRTAFAQAFPGEPISPATIGKAIATFERGVISARAPFDQWIRGDENAIDASAKRGFMLFNTTARCSACHSGWRFTDDSFHDIGLRDDDIGRGKLVEGVELLRYAFKTPGLRNITQRAPYMHNGSLGTLEEVVEHYSRGFVFRPSKSAEIHRLALSSQDTRDLVAFMETLTSADPEITAPPLPK